MNKQRLIWFLVIFLVGLNITVTAFLLVERLQHKPDTSSQFAFPPPRKGHDAFEFIVRNVKMNDEQRQKYAQLRDEHHMMMMDLRKEFNEERKKLFRSFGVITESVMDEQLRKVAHTQFMVDSITVRHFQQVRGILNSDQQRMFDEILVEATEMMKPQLPPPPPDRKPGDFHDEEKFERREDRP